MEDITVRKTELLAKLRENRAAHSDLFEKAQTGYKARVVEELERRLKDARDGKRIEMIISLSTPIDQTEDYDRVIAMLEMDTNEAVFLSEQDFRCYVMDKWAWAEHAFTTNSSYLVQ